MLYLHQACRFSVEERNLIALNPAIADVIREPAWIGGGAGWESFNQDIVELETNVLRYPVTGSACVPTSRPRLEYVVEGFYFGHEGKYVG